MSHRKRINSFTIYDSKRQKYYSKSTIKTEPNHVAAYYEWIFIISNKIRVSHDKKNYSDFAWILLKYFDAMFYKRHVRKYSCGTEYLKVIRESIYVNLLFYLFVIFILQVVISI